MTKILKFPHQATNQISFMEHFNDLVKSGEIEKIVILAKPKQNSGKDYVLTGYFACDVIDKQEMLSHMQVDITMDIMKVNIGDLVEYIE